MFIIDSHGKVIHAKIKQVISIAIQKRAMNIIQGIIVHQTDSPTAK